jgi:small subunit ribosomal protein S6
VSKYELVYLVAPDTPEEKQTEIADRLKGYVQQLGGTLESLDLWEKRKLAYEIRKVREAFYYILRFEGDGKLVDELERRLKVADEVIRFLTVRLDEVLEVAEKRKKKLAPPADRPEPSHRERRPRHEDEVSHE